MTFRDDGDAARMRADALARELADKERALEEERRARAEADEARVLAERRLAAAEKQLGARERAKTTAKARAEPRARTGDASSPSSAPPSARRKAWMLGGGAVAGVVGVGLCFAVLSGPAGIALPTARTPERAVPGCSCSFDDGRTVRLGLRVLGASRMENAPGRPWSWFLQWIAHLGSDRMTLGGAAPSGGIWGDGDVRAYLACTGRDRLVVASFSNVSAYSLSEHRLLWDRDTMNHLATGSGASCGTLAPIRDGIVRVPGNDGPDLRLRLSDGHDAD